MDDDQEQTHRHRKGIGADLILPLMAAGYAAYYVYSIAEFPWEAQMNGTFIAIILWLLVAIMLARTALQLRRGEVTLRATAIIKPRDKLVLRLLFVGLTGLSILLMPWLGFTLTIFLFILSGMWLLGVRAAKHLVIIPLTASAVGYLLFIVTLDTRLPHGPVEMLLQSLA